MQRSIIVVYGCLLAIGVTAVPARVAREAGRIFLVAREIEAAAAQYERFWELQGADSAAVTRVHEGIRFSDAETLRMIGDSLSWFDRTALFLAVGDTAAAIEELRNIRVMPGEVFAGDLYPHSLYSPPPPPCVRVS